MTEHLGVLKTLSAGVMAVPTMDAATGALTAFERLTGRQAPEDHAALLATGGDPMKIKQWAAGHALKADELLPKLQNTDQGGTRLFSSTNPVTGVVTQNSSVPITQSANDLADNLNRVKTTGMTTASHERVAAAGREQALTLANRGVIHDTDAGTFVIDPHTSSAKPVTDPGTGDKLQKPLKNLPPAVNDAIIGNAQTLYTLDKAIKLAGGKSVDSSTGDAAATGWKGYLPQAMLNRIDASGVDTRAEIADIGSLKIHDRSGAAVTASESPRLMPFIPNARDDQPTVVRKLTRLMEEAQRMQQSLSDTYSKEQGYKPSPVKSQTAAAPAGQPGAAATPGIDFNAIAAEIARRGGK